MSKDKLHNNPKIQLHNDPKIQDESLPLLYHLSLWSQSGIDWSSTIKEEVQESINQPIEKKKSKTTRKVVWFGVLTTLALLGAATWPPAPKIYQMVREVNTNFDSGLQELNLR